MNDDSHAPCHAAIAMNDDLLEHEWLESAGCLVFRELR